MELKYFRVKVKVKADSGIFSFRVPATSKDAAIRMITKLEACPLSAIKSVRELGKKYPRTIDKIVNKLSCKYGAPMGRADIGTRPDGVRVFDCAVPMSDAAYDRGGAYWGIGGQLRVSYTKDLSYVQFYRTN